MANSVIKVNNGSVSVTSDGIKTYRTLLYELWGLIDVNKVSINSKIVFVNQYIVGLSRKTDGTLIYSYVNLSTNGLYNAFIFSVANNSNYCLYVDNNTSGQSSNLSDNVATSGLKIELYY